MMRTSLRTHGCLAALLVLAVALAACGSDDDSSSSGSQSNSSAASGESCPFGGSTDAQTQAGVAGNTTLSSVATTVSGCVDQLTFAFAPSLASTAASYTSGEPQLVVTLKNTSYSGPATPPPKKLQYVKSIAVSAAGGDVRVTLTLDRVHPFLMSTSKVPAQLQLAIG
jgi:AMIN domain-containing protein